MKNRIDKVLSQVKAKKKKALVAYMSAGYPAFNEQFKLVKTLEQSGADILELGVPFSDPIADGPTIQFASQESLKRGTSLTKILKWVSGWTAQVSMPVVFMTYMNPILAFGLEKFAAAAAKA